MNAFESGLRKVIPAVLIYARFQDHVLMIHRDGGRRGKQGGVDFHEGKWNGLGGKCEIDESPAEAAFRELEEESGIRVSLERFESLGVLQFPNFKPHKNEDWIVFVFTVQLLASDFENRSPFQPGEWNFSLDEGTLYWIPAEKVSSLNLWSGDSLFISNVLKGIPFLGTIWYQRQASGPNNNLAVSKYWIKNLRPEGGVFSSPNEN